MRELILNEINIVSGGTVCASDGITCASVVPEEDAIIALALDTTQLHMCLLPLFVLVMSKLF